MHKVGNGLFCIIPSSHNMRKFRTSAPVQTRFAKAPEAARMDWSAFTKGFFLLLLVDASVLPQKIDLDCANWLGRNNVHCSS
ncbi:hypothetical protein ACE6H2_005367 [Prunus campanulata]